MCILKLELDEYPNSLTERVEMAERSALRKRRSSDRRGRMVSAKRDNRYIFRKIYIFIEIINRKPKNCYWLAFFRLVKNENFFSSLFSINRNFRKFYYKYRYFKKGIIFLKE